MVLSLKAPQRSTEALRALAASGSTRYAKAAQAELKARTTAGLSKGGKYRNQPVEIDGIRFASKREGRRYSELKLLERGGVIRGLKLQPRFPMEVAGVLVCTYVADFAYERDGRMVVEDAKGVRTDVYVIKAKLLKAIHGFDVVEV